MQSEGFKKILSVVGILLGVALIVFVVFLTRNEARQFDYIGRSAEQDNTITISGTDEVVVVPDVAKIQLGIFTTDPEVTKAQKTNTDKMNLVIKAMKDLGLDDKDIKTAYYNVNPEYDWLEGERVFKGYRVSQAIDLKIRDTGKTGSILDKATELGVNDVGALRFEVDDLDDVKQQARIAALANAKEKAQEMAAALDVKLGRIIGFSEETSTPPTPYLAKEAYGLGINMEADAAPAIEPGSSEVSATVYVTYELL